MKGNVVRSWRAGLVGAVFIFGMSGLASVPAAAQAAVQQITDCTAEGSPLITGTLAYATSQGGTWTFACSGTAPFTIDIATTLDVPSNKSVTLLGGQVVTLDGGGAKTQQIFWVPSTGSLTLAGLTLENGGTGAVSNYGALTVSNSTFSGNSNLGGYGGAIFNYGTLTVSNSTFSGNTAGLGGSGGAIFNEGTMTVSNSTFSGNTAEIAGAILNSYLGTMTVSNSTFSGNSAIGGGQGGAIDSGGTATVSNSILASPSGGNCIGIAFTAASTHNLEYGDASNTCGSSVVTTGDPLLGALADNGGPTQTMALGAGSAAIGAGDPTICASAPVNGFDQRGVARGTTMATCDIGAYQATAPSQADLAAQYVLQPSPIAPFGTLASGQTEAATVYTETYTGAMAPDVPVYLSFTGGTGSASVGGVPLTATPQLFTSDGSGGIAVQYTAGTTPTGSGTDTITVADAATNPTLQASDSYSYVTFATLGALAGQFETQPGIASALNAKLGAAAAAAARGNTRALDGALGAFQNAVRAQTGKTITPAQAAILIRQAQELER